MSDTHSLMALQGGCLLRIYRQEGGVTGEVLLPDAGEQRRGTRLFHAPLHPGVDELAEWANKAVRAYMEG
ncbi:hypothetical protein [Paenibacillus puerhi]|uniref:hypothetical protein n=1 Tax=Paenibacillus puerhi TaxID=2692622 RepID=UPI001359BB37|nr:hypothetical protein [Paenibacillus puerhi]